MLSPVAAMEWLLEHLSSLSATSVYLVVAGILLLCGLGLPMPEDITLISAGYMAHLGIVDVHRVFVLCFLTVLAGDGLAFAVGWFFGHRILHSEFSQRHFKPKKQRRVRAYFRKFGSKVIFIARFLPGLRFSVFLSAGTLRVRPSTFFIYDTLAAVLSVPALVYLAYAFGEHIDKVIRWVRRSEYGILALFVIALGVVAAKLWRRARARALPPVEGTSPAESATGTEPEPQDPHPSRSGTSA